jgi:hypothetical protein
MPATNARQLESELHDRTQSPPERPLRSTPASFDRPRSLVPRKAPPGTVEKRLPARRSGGLEIGDAHTNDRRRTIAHVASSIIGGTPVGVPFAMRLWRSGSCQCHVESGCRSARVSPPSFRSCSSAVESGRAAPTWARSAIGGLPSIKPGSSTSYRTLAYFAANSAGIAVIGRIRMSR